MSKFNTVKGGLSDSAIRPVAPKAVGPGPTLVRELDPTHCNENRDPHTVIKTQSSQTHQQTNKNILKESGENS